MKRGHCRESTCRAEVLFVRTKNDKTQIVDAKPEKRIVLFDPVNGNILTAKDLEQRDDTAMSPRALVVDTYVDHHATCTNAAKFKKGLEVVADYTTGKPKVGISDEESGAGR